MSQRVVRRRNLHLDEQRHSLVRSFLLIAMVVVVGVVGYTLLAGEEYGLLDAIYMTMVTLTTVGYGEVIDLSGNTPGRIFTMCLLVVGAGSFVYFFSNFTAFVVEGNLNRLLWRRKMRRAIMSMRDHFVVCGGGITGMHVARELVATERPFVVIESDEDRARELSEELGGTFAVVVGDATDDDALLEARVHDASGLAACVETDKDNLIIVMSARMLKPQLRIVARCVESAYQKKMKQAGADAIVSPETIGGLRLVSELVRPNVVSFLDIMLRDRDKKLRVEELLIGPNSPLAGKSVADLRASSPQLNRLLVVAIRLSDDGWVFNPDENHLLSPGESLVIICEPAIRAALERHAAAPSRSSSTEPS